MPRMLPYATAFLLALTSLAITPVIQPERALAVNETVTTCDEESFDAALAAVLAADGGVIILDCVGTITFSTTKVINRNVEIYGSGAVTLDGGASVRIFRVTSGGHLSIFYLTLQNGRAPGGQFAFGGGIYNQGTLDVVATTFTGNRSNEGSGGALSNDGGGARATVIASTFKNNHALSGGGALENFRGQVEVFDSTFTSNTTGVGPGSVLFAQRQSGNQGRTVFRGSTIAGNTDGHEIYLLGDPEVRIGSSIFDGVCVLDAVIVSDGYNLVSSTTNCNFDQATDILAEDILADIGALADNGGPTQTLLPSSESDALEAIPPADCAALNTPTGQRGVARPQATNCEIGAVEVTTGPIPVQIFGVHNFGPGFEQSPVGIHVVAFVPDGETALYEFDCANDGVFELSQEDDPSGACTYPNSGDYTVAVRVSDSATSAQGTTDVSIETAPPTIGTIMTLPHPSAEGQQVDLAVTFSDPSQTDSHTCEIDWGDGSLPTMGSVSSTQCAATHIYADDPAGTPDDYTISVEICDLAQDCDEDSSSHTVQNVAPAIDITTNGPIVQGQAVTVTVDANDPGVNDSLSYSFDCDNDGAYEIGPQTSNQTMCALDPAVATSTIGAQVLDDDLGVTVGAVEVKQVLTLCGNSWNGSLSLRTRAGCPAGTFTLTLPAAYSSTTLCYTTTGSLVWKPSGSCGASWITHRVPLDGPLTFCASIWTKQLSHSWSGACGPYETPGVIPG